MHRTFARRARHLVVATFAVVALAAPAHAQLGLGDAMPMGTVKMKSVTGKDLTLAASAGKQGTLVVFTCNACPWAKKWQSRVAEIGNSALAAGLGVVAVNSNDPAMNAEDGYKEMQKRAKDLGFKFPYVVDATSDVARAFGATRTPEAFVFDAGGKLVYHGTVDDNANDAAAVKETWLKNAVSAVAEGKAVAVAETKAMGGSIKFRAKKS